MELIKNNAKNEEGGFDMCKAFDDMQAEHWCKGRRCTYINVNYETIVILCNWVDGLNSAKTLVSTCIQLNTCVMIITQTGCAKGYNHKPKKVIGRKENQYEV